MSKGEWISWVGPGWYAPMATYGAWVYVGEMGRDDLRLRTVKHFNTRDEFEGMLELEKEGVNECDRSD